MSFFFLMAALRFNNLVEGLDRIGPVSCILLGVIRRWMGLLLYEYSTMLSGFNGFIAQGHAERISLSLGIVKIISSGVCEMKVTG